MNETAFSRALSAVQNTVRASVLVRFASAETRTVGRRPGVL